MSLNSLIQLDAAAFVNSDDFAETVTYTKTNGNTRQISAVVVRDPPARLDSRGVVVTPRLEVYVANSATTGISGAELDTGGDTITVAVRPGGIPQALSINLSTASDSQDAGILQLDLR